MSSPRFGSRSRTDADKPFDAAVMSLPAAGELPDDLQSYTSAPTRRLIIDGASRFPLKRPSEHEKNDQSQFSWH
jgi:hypothetical protein